MPNGRKIFLIDTPGFDDSYRSDTEILGEIADWLAQTYQFKIRLTGLIYLHRIIDIRVGGSGMKNLRMFRKVCGERGLASVVLATTMWSLCPEADAARREEQLVQKDDLWKHLVGRGARIFRQDRGVESGQKILDYLINLGQPVTLEIQREMVDQNKTLAETAAGLEVQEELEKLKKKHDEEMREIRQDMDEALREKDEERQRELREYQSQIDDQMRAAAQQAKKLEMSREGLRREMKEQHQREIGQLREEIWKRQQELESTSRENTQRYTQLMKELEDFKTKASRSEMKEGYHYEFKRKCPRCSAEYVFNDVCSTIYCRVCRESFDVTVP
jgi:hypothetical protein